MLSENEVIKKYLGAPYNNNCWGLVKAVYADLGFMLRDLSGNGREIADTRRASFATDYWKEWTQVSIPELFDVALFLDERGVAVHAGIMLSNSYVLHACEKYGVINTRIGDLKGRKTFGGYFHLKARNG